VSPAMQLQHSGKCQGRRSLAAMSVGQGSMLLFIEDALSGRRLLVDSGTQRSILPASTGDTMSGGHGPPHGRRQWHAHTYLRHQVRGGVFRRGAFRLGLCDGHRVSSPPGRGLSLCLQPAGGRHELSLGRCHLLLHIPVLTGGPGTLGLSNMLAAGDEYQRLLAQFPDLTTPTFSSAVAKHGVEHYITTTGPPVYARTRRLDSAKLAIARGEFATMERLGIVCRSDSPWASHLHMVMKSFTTRRCDERLPATVAPAPPPTF